MRQRFPQRRIGVLGPDRPGIVHELTRALHSSGFNVLQLETSVETAPMSGEPMFRAEAVVELLEGCRLDELEWQLDAMAERMTLDIDIEDA
jgi:glycine cleavage system regulatory protein